jgi:tetratricopeptide (TPR) repeat protein
MRRVTLLAAVAALASLLGPETVPANDGGVRSTFAFGAGNRALAMGGAYAAISDDASGAIWNPAGLGRLSQREFQASSARLYGLEMNEQFASLAWPSWRWGAAALVFRRFAVGGIERRDDRNILLSEFDDSETEFSVAYGRSPSEKWSFGALVKMQRQAIAGYDDFGLGLDVGIQSRPGLLLGHESGWAHRLSFGLAVRNAVEPSLRLDRDAVADPAAVRTGLAYVQPIGGSRSLLATVDVEKAREADTDLHAGLEARLHSLVALRGGFNGEGYTAGAGLRWRDYAFDYVLEENEIESVHRFGATIAFGPTTEESRLAARAAEEEEFRRRLAETYRLRQEQRARELAERAESLLGERRFDEALDVASALAALAPDDTLATSYQSRALQEKALLAEVDEDFAEASILYGRVLAIAPDHERAAAGLARCRAESDRRAARTARIRDLFALALDAFSSGDLVTARSRLQEILDVSPDDAEARAMLRRTETAISVRVSALLARAGRSLDRALLGDAEEALEEAFGLDPDADGIPLLRARLRKAEEELAAAARRRERAVAAAPSPTNVGAPVAPAPVPKAPALSEKKRREIAELYRSGMEAMQADRADDALHYWELVWMNDPEFRDVAEYLKREYLLRGLESFSRGGLDDAIRLWERALEVDPEDEKTLGYLARAREQQARSQEILGNPR